MANHYYSSYLVVVDPASDLGCLLVAVRAVCSTRAGVGVGVRSYNGDPYFT